MVILKKLKATTLMETLVATVLIVVVFMLASMILNNLFSSTIVANTRNMNTALNKIEYLYFNDKLTLPYDEVIGDWTLSVERRKAQPKDIILLEAYNTKTQKHIIRKHSANY